MKGNNSLTCAKTVQKQPFLMSDTSRPPDAFYVSNSLIKQHPGERDRGHMKCVRECVCVCITFGVWIVRCDLGTLIFTQQGSITLVVVLFIVFLLWQSTGFLSFSFFFFFPPFRQTLNIKRVKSKKWNSLQWGVLPAKEWGGVRVKNDCRCVLLKNNSVIYIFLFFSFSEMSCAAHCIRWHLLFGIFLSNSQTAACTVAHSIANTKEHHCKFAYQCVLSTSVPLLCYNFQESSVCGYIKAFKW